MTVMDDEFCCPDPRPGSLLLSQVGFSVPIDALLPADSPRADGVDESYVRALAKVDGPLPPIVVHRSTMQVVDGMHRLQARVLRGCTEIDVRFFDGSLEDAFVAAVEANVANGRPLSLEDRRAAAGRIILSHPDRSDRWIAQVSGLAAGTVGALRQCSTAQDGQSNVRLGRDGRMRPVDGTDGRRLAAELMRADPERSLRGVARAVGISPSTALDVRNRIRAGVDPVPPRRHRDSSDTDGESTAPRKRRPSRQETVVNPQVTLRQLRADPTLRFTEAGRALLRWLDAHTMDPTLGTQFLSSIPSHCGPMIASLARHNSQLWADLADSLATTAENDVESSRREY